MQIYPPQYTDDLVIWVIIISYPFHLQQAASTLECHVLIFQADRFALELDWCNHKDLLLCSIMVCGLRLAVSNLPPPSLPLPPRGYLCQRLIYIQDILLWRDNPEVVLQIGRFPPPPSSPSPSSPSQYRGPTVLREKGEGACSRTAIDRKCAAHTISRAGHGKKASIRPPTPRWKGMQLGRDPRKEFKFK